MPIRIRPVCPARRLDPVADYRVDDGVVIVELRAVPDCPNVEATRRGLRACLADAGLSDAGLNVAGVPVTVIERTGEYPSPSVLVDGRDVTGADPDGAAACVLRP